MLNRLPNQEPIAGELQRMIDRLDEICYPPSLAETRASTDARAERRAAKIELERLKTDLHNLREPQGRNAMTGEYVDGPRRSELHRAIAAAEIRLQKATQAYSHAIKAEGEAFHSAVRIKIEEAAPTLAALFTLVLDALDPLQELQLHGHRHGYPVPSTLSAVPALTLAARNMVAQFNGRDQKD